MSHAVPVPDWAVQKVDAWWAADAQRFVDLQRAVAGCRCPHCTTCWMPPVEALQHARTDLTLKAQVVIALYYGLSDGIQPRSFSEIARWLHVTPSGPIQHHNKGMRMLRSRVARIRAGLTW